jgi:hypothetical protein
MIEYKTSMESLMKNISNLPTQEKSQKMFFIETTPQHFKNTKTNNGYYRMEIVEKTCEAIKSDEVGHKLDWRNRILESTLDTDYGRKVNILLLF